MYDLVSAALAAALSVAGAPSDAQAERRPPIDPDRVVCRNLKVTGSRLARQRVCMTAAQWAEERRQTQQGVERLQVRGRRDGE